MTHSADWLADVRRTIRDVPDFPKPGIVFKDITPVLGNALLFKEITDEFARRASGLGVTHVVGIESRGFILAAPIAQALGAGFVPVRKPGKLPAKSLREGYALEYGTDALEVHEDGLGAGARGLLVDDVLATGGTAAAACRLLERAGAAIVACEFLIELTFLGGRSRLGDRRTAALLTY